MQPSIVVDAAQTGIGQEFFECHLAVVSIAPFSLDRTGSPPYGPEDGL
jgi:hypothetical protein